MFQKQTVFNHLQDWTWSVCWETPEVGSDFFSSPQHILGPKYSNYLKFHWLAAQEIEALFFNPQVNYTVQVRNSALCLLNHSAFWPERVTLSRDEGDSISMQAKRQPSPNQSAHPIPLLLCLMVWLPQGWWNWVQKNLFKGRTIHAGRQTPPVPVFKFLRAPSAINTPMKLSLVLEDWWTNRAEHRTQTKRHFLASMQHQILFLRK